MENPLLNNEIDWLNKEEVFKFCLLGEMSKILIKSMSWEESFAKYKADMQKEFLLGKNK